MTAPAPIDAINQARHKWRNRLHTVLLAGGSLALLAACAYVFAGAAGIFWAALLGGLSLWMSTRVSPDLVLRLYKARRLAPEEFPEGQRIVRLVAARAGLAAPPDLYYVPSNLMNAFSVGKPGQSAIGVTDALIRRLSPRQFAGVIAHELSHIRNEDIKVMALADMVSRLTSAMSFVGLFTLFLNVPAILAGGGQVPWLGIALLWTAPTVGALLQLALSRAREYDADLDAAGLTGDPEGLASALVRLERSQGRMWEMVLPGGRVPQPSVLRSHPGTEERVRRLMSLKPAARRFLDLPDGSAKPPPGSVPVIPGPRRRVSSMGLWY
jgi:heat shock protein HtpX